jgi:hypothetical protein
MVLIIASGIIIAKQAPSGLLRVLHHKKKMV